MRTTVGMWLVGLALLLAGCATTPVSYGVIDALATDVVVNADGSLDVEETFTIRPDATGRMVFRRSIESPYADGVTFLDVSVDGDPVEPDAAHLIVEQRTSKRVVVEWKPTASSATATTFVLRYRATAAVAAREPRGRLEWPVLAAGRGFDVGTVRIGLELPEGVRTYDGTGMAEPGWNVEMAPRGIVAHRTDVDANDSATLLAVFDLDRSRVTPSQWEWDLDRQRQYFLALVSAGLFILIIGVGILILLRVQFPPVAADATREVVDAARADRQMIARNLWISGWVGVVFAAICAGLAFLFLSGLGIAVYAIPGAMAAVSVGFLAASFWYARHARADFRQVAPG